MCDLDDLLDPGLDHLVAWARERGTALPARPAGVVLALLVLRGARVRGGLPEPTVALIRQIMDEDLPQLVTADPEELRAYPDVLAALIDQRREAGLLNAKRQSKLHTALQESIADYEQAMTDPVRLTWPRLYAGLLRADGVDPTDRQAVWQWLCEYRERPLSQRRAIFESALGTPAVDDTGIISRQRTVILGLRTENAELVLQGLLLTRISGILDATANGSAQAEPAPGFDRTTMVDDATDALLDRGTAVGLSAALRGEFRDLTPRRDNAATVTDLLMRELRRIQKDVSGGDTHLPPTDDVPATEIAELLRSSALLPAAAGLAEWVEQQGGVTGGPDAAAPAAREFAAGQLGLPPQILDEVWRHAVAVGLLRPADGRIVTGGALQVWRDGTAGELVQLGLDAFGAVATELTHLAERAEQADVPSEERGTIEALVEDLPFTLFQLFEEPAPASLARMAAVAQMWVLPYDLEEIAQLPPLSARNTVTLAAQLRPPRPMPSDPDQLTLMFGDDDESLPAAYHLPADDELRRLLPQGELDASDRTELLGIAYWQALLVDRLAALGVMQRADDRVELTRLGRALVRVGFQAAGGTAPTIGEIAAVDADELLRSMPSWTERIRLHVLQTWLDARGDIAKAWQELLAAIAGNPHSRRAIFDLLGVRYETDPTRDLRHVVIPQLPAPLEDPVAEHALRTALHEAVDDPINGALAAEALRLRGEQPADPPLSAQAVLLFERLNMLTFAEYRARQPAEYDTPDEDEVADENKTADGTQEAEQDTMTLPLGSALCVAFDQAAANWPGGAGELLRQFTAVAPELPGYENFLETLGQAHSQPAVAKTARTAARQAHNRPRSGDDASTHTHHRKRSSSSSRKKRRRR
ncbi:hypothetical protein [Protofrankia symbiont of Coriaria ruscifolia]|uniref:hypothetical protein n=1 Tax=Protofrankia symbiont of Coriaria ruscifolia TaxID=1306542 RepID=UPI0010412D5E|nr:hypothetical protein [Protofrankia symbiont of Coriaria ruscifolia]